MSDRVHRNTHRGPFGCAGSTLPVCGRRVFAGPGEAMLGEQVRIRGRHVDRLESVSRGDGERLGRRRRVGLLPRQPSRAVRRVRLLKLSKRLLKLSTSLPNSSQGGAGYDVGEDDLHPGGPAGTPRHPEDFVCSARPATGSPGRSGPTRAFGTRQRHAWRTYDETGRPLASMEDTVLDRRRCRRIHDECRRVGPVVRAEPRVAAFGHHVLVGLGAQHPIRGVHFAVCQHRRALVR